MPRKPTGRPSGRPPGSGKLGKDHTRLTVRVPRTLYEWLESYAEGRSFTSGTPQLALCVREALEVYRDSKRQTKIVPRDEIRQTKNVPAPAYETMPQTDNGRVLDTATLDAMPLEPDESVSASFDTSRFYLGMLCPNGHAHDGTGKSLRRHSKGDCHACDLARKRTTRQAKRQAAPGA